MLIADHSLIANVQEVTVAESPNVVMHQFPLKILKCKAVLIKSYAEKRSFGHMFLDPTDGYRDIEPHSSLSR
jgi:hypothetical protein